MNDQWKKFIPACVAGNILELYEFIIYGYFASTIGELFFPTKDKYIALMLAFGVVATGSLIRPFSALILGYMGDKFGRRQSLIISVGMMSIATFFIGILPTYAQIGMLAPTLLVLLRMLQGLSMTSEEIGAGLFLMESAPADKKGFASCLILGSVYLGLLLGSIVAAILFALIDAPALLSWGWRIPFLLGGSAGFCVLIMRLRQPESPEFNLAVLNKHILKNPLHVLLKNHISTLIRSTFLFCLIAIAVYFYAVYIPNTMKMSPLGSDKDIIMLICSFGFLTTFLVSLAVGKLVDLIGEKIPMILACSGFIVLSYPIFLLLSYQSYLSLIFGYLLFSVLLGIMAGSVMLAAISPFPVTVRFSGACLAFNISMSFFGGPAPMLALYLSNATESFTSPSLVLIMGAFISLGAILIGKNNSKEPIYGNTVRC